MGEMRLWNGSEFQLLRFLGRHRRLLDSEIIRHTNINPDLDYDVEWMDFFFDVNKKIDSEHSGISFLLDDSNDGKSFVKNYAEIYDNWKKYWPQTGTQQNWDAVIHCTH